MMDDDDTGGCDPKVCKPPYPVLSAPTQPEQPYDIQTDVFQGTSVKTVSEEQDEAADAINTLVGPVYTGQWPDYAALGISGITWLSQQQGPAEFFGLPNDVVSAVYASPYISSIGAGDSLAIELIKIAIQNNSPETIQYTNITIDRYYKNSQTPIEHQSSTIYQSIPPAKFITIDFDPYPYIPSDQYMVISFYYKTTNYFGNTTHQISP